MIDEYPVLDCFDQFYLTAIDKGIEEIELPAIKLLEVLKLKCEPDDFNKFYKRNKKTYLLFHLIDIRLRNDKFSIKFNTYKKYTSKLKYSRNFILREPRRRSKRVKPIERNKEKEICIYAY